MIVLGIDTSCDDTAAGLVENGRRIMSNVVHSQVMLHHSHGGVVPELASREHLKNIMAVVREALSRAHLKMADLGAIAVTVGPGLVGALLVGLYYAKGLAYVHGVPLLAVNHLEGHILSIFLEDEAPAFPFVALTVSGGHTSLYHVKGFCQYELLGQTLDDAAGEAFDKVAKTLGLGYPGGAAIERLAQAGRKDIINFPRAYISKGSLDFSFSGLKTAVALFIKRQLEDKGSNADVMPADIAAAFQESVVDVLAHKLLAAARKACVRSVVMAGGVACNNRLRDKLSKMATGAGIRVYSPRPEFCTDNGAMIAVAGYHRLLQGQRADLAVDVKAKFPIQALPPITPSSTNPAGDP